MIRYTIVLLLFISTGLVNAQPAEDWPRLIHELELNPETADADDLNRKGLQLYQMNRYADAAILFQQSILRNPSHYYAPYNLICMKSLMLAQGAEVSEGEIFSRLFRYGVQHPERLEKIRTDSDLAILRDKPAYRYLTEQFENLQVLYSYMDSQYYILSIESSRRIFGETEMVIKADTEKDIYYYPADRIKRVDLEERSILILERYVPSQVKDLEEQPYGPPNVSNVETAVEVLLFDSRTLEVLDHTFWWNNGEPDLYFNNVQPLMKAEAFGDSSFYITLALFSSSFSEETLFMMVQNSSLYVSSPVTTASENLSGLNFGRTYDFSELREQSGSIRIGYLDYNQEEEEIAGIPPESSIKGSLVLKPGPGNRLVED